ncbi:MAG: nucleotidyltransferase domain-containing protein [Candidatus Omnitrophica bacterium]|nr:nucleotidyltransferase domain-containing protein [Candidatus Omnitrophota bacterium]
MEKEIKENEYITRLKKAVVSYFKEDNVKIILFGSRARGQEYRSSDVDIGIIPFGDTEIENVKITYLKEEIENLNIPYKAEIVNFSEVSADFKKEALKEVIIWKDWN